MSNSSCPTVEIQTEPSEGNPSGIVVINQEDFNPETMQLVSGSSEQFLPQNPVPVVTPVAPVSVLNPETGGTLAPPPWATK